jgi:hypothetical protein
MNEAEKKAVVGFFEELLRHQDHCWQQVGRCVYCADCGQRLYQGQIPPEHTNVKRRSFGTPKATRDMRERWGMDR